MRKTLALVAVVLAVGMAATVDAQARRLGGARSAGMQRQSVTAPAAPATAPANGSAATQTAPAAATGAAAGTAAAATQRSWMGPIAGIAAGLGIAALASHFGFGGALANILTVGLLVMLAVGVLGFVMRKRMAMQGGLAGATGAGGIGGARGPAQALPFGGSAIGSRVAGGPAIPADFDKAGFERTARDQFIALQAANDARDVDRLRDYLSPEMAEVARAEIAERGDAPQKTEVFGLQAQVLEVVQDADRYVVSVRFTGSIREQAGAGIEELDEVWHLTKPKSGLAGWVIAGIQQAH